MREATTAPRVSTIASALLADGGADVRTRTTAAAVYWRRQLIGRPATRAEAQALRLAYASRRRAVAELVRMYTP